MVNSESDFLPGLIIDRFDNKFSFQIFSAGMELFKSDIIDFLNNKFKADYIIEKNINSLRSLEGLEEIEKVHLNNLPSDEFITDIDGIKYSINLLKGQKTGFYLDQSASRKNIKNYISDNFKILDLFCNEGGFSLNAAAVNKYNQITAVDSSEYAISKAIKNSELNNFKNINFICSDVFDFLKSDKSYYDLIILDPPSFTKSKKNLDAAVYGYINLNSNCLSKLNKNGFLFTYSCSHHITPEIFLNIISKSAKLSGKNIQIIHYSDCSYDHPILPQMPETKYLKEFVIRILN